MSTPAGFGNVKTPKKSTNSAAKRVSAGKKYEKMKSDGAPQFNIYIRIQDKNTWFPAGSLAVERTNQIVPAIFQEEINLRQGAFRLYPVLKKHQNQLEYGYRLKGKEYADEPIELAVAPTPIVPNFIQSALRKMQKRLTSLLKKD